MQQLLVLWSGRHDREPWRSLARDYEERIRRQWKIEQRMVRAKARDDARRLREEGEATAASCPRGSVLVALDAGGKQYSSERFAGQLEDWFGRSQGPVVFAIGSDLGLGPAVRQAAHSVLSFGPMTLPHELARVILLEQVYRALAIRTGIKYHRDPSQGR